MECARATALAALALSAAPATAGASGPKPPIKHVVIIIQENRSFDSYFGTFPGADGIPAGTCVPYNPKKPQLGCLQPFHDPRDANAGATHSAQSAQFDIDDGITTAKMDGFLTIQSESFINCDITSAGCPQILDGVGRHDSVGYHTAEEIPNYWAYAKTFVLQDHLFEGVRAWSWPSHLDLTSEWSAACTDNTKAATCTTNNVLPTPAPDLTIPWVNLFQLLDTKGVSWKYYLGGGKEPDCEDDELTCSPAPQQAGVPSIWNPVPFFMWVKSRGPDYVKQHNPNLDQFLLDVKNGTLPNVAWVVPSDAYSEHPPAGVTRGMEYVTSMVNAVMQSPYWRDTAIFIAWDDWGGFYDHVAPPNVDTNPSKTPVQGFGLRVPGLMISAYAKPGYIDHQVLSLDSYATLIENLFAGGARLDPTALGNPDNRPDIRDALATVRFPDGQRAKIGRLLAEFDFTQTPLPPLVLPTHIPTDIAVTCSPIHRTSCTTPTVTISWSPITGPGIPGLFTYHVQRDSVELPQCTGTATSCTDTPGSGVHLYRAYSVAAGQVTSPLSAAAEADVP